MRIYSPDWQRSESAFPRNTSTGSAFAARMSRANFNSASLGVLERMLVDAIALDPNDEYSRLELALVRMQNRLTREGLAVVRDLLNSCGPSARRDRAMQVIELFERNARENVFGWVPARVNWSVNNECPMICRGCYNPFTGKSLDARQSLKLASRLVDAGVRGVMISGGDPLLWEPLEAVLAFLRSKGVAVGLDTTGHPMVQSRLFRILPLLETLGLPLDALDSVSAKKFRRGAGVNVVESVKELLLVTGLPKVRIHTVVSRANVEHLRSIQDALEETPNVIEWALYQFWPRRAPSSVSDQMAIAPIEFREAVAALPSGRVEVFSYPYDVRAFMNFMILANGEAVTFGEEPEEEYLVGSILDEDVAVVLSRPGVQQGKLVRRLLAGSVDPL